MNLSDEVSNNYDEINDKEYFDFNQIYRSLISEKKLILLITILSFLSSFIIASTKKHIWKGQFQIVISDNNTNSNQTSLQDFQNLFFDSSAFTNNNLGTQVGILESPSVLMPVFKFVQNNTLDKSKTSKNYRFSSWKKDNLRIRLKEGTNILEINYLDTEKEMIIPTLNKIIQEYKKYSRKDIETGNKNLITYLNKQIDIFQNKVLDSVEKADEYALKNNLTLDLNLKSSSENLAEGISSITDVSSEGIEKKSINKQLNFLNLVRDKMPDGKEINQDTLLSVANLLDSNILEDPVIMKLKNLDQEIATSKSIYTDKVINTKLLENERDNLLEILQKRLINYLNNEEEFLNKRLLSLERDKGVYIKYRGLVRDLIRNEKTLANLENRRNEVILKSEFKAKTWDTISEATLFNIPTSPNKKRIVLVGSLFGLFLGSLVGVIRDKNKFLLYKTIDFEKILRLKVIYEVSKNDEDDLRNLANLINYGLMENNDNFSLAIISFGNIDKICINKLENYIKSYNEKIEIVFTDDLAIAKNSSIQIVAIAEREINETQLLNFRNSLKLQGNKTKGLIIFREK